MQWPGLNNITFRLTLSATIIWFLAGCILPKNYTNDCFKGSLVFLSIPLLVTKRFELPLISMLGGMLVVSGSQTSGIALQFAAGVTAIVDHAIQRTPTPN